MVIVFLPALDGIRPQWREAAVNLGASTWQYWRRVAGPLLLPAFLGSTLLLFANAFAAYATAAVLVSQGHPILPLLIRARPDQRGRARPAEPRVRAGLRDGRRGGGRDDAVQRCCCGAPPGGCDEPPTARRALGGWRVTAWRRAGWSSRSSSCCRCYAMLDFSTRDLAARPHRAGLVRAGAATRCSARRSSPRCCSRCSPRC